METDEFEYEEFKVEASSSNDYEYEGDDFGLGTKCGNIFISNIGKYTFICDFCKHSYENMEHFAFHLKESKHLKHSETEETIAEFVTYDNISETKIVIEKCEFEPITFNHMKTHPIPAADEMKQSPHPGEIIEFVDVNEVNVLNVSCPEPKLSVPVPAFKEINAYSHHIKLNDEMKQYDCGELNEDCSTEFTLNNRGQQYTEGVSFKRIKSVNASANVYCEICDRKFAEAMGIKFHAEKMHPDTIPQVLMTDPFYRMCKYCKKPFEKVSDRIQHERTHDEEKKYSCSFCSKRFSNKTMRESHENVHKGIAPFQCRHCPAKYTSGIKLRTHIRDAHLGDQGQLNEDQSAELTANNTEQKSTESEGAANPLKSPKISSSAYCEICDRNFLDTMRLKFHAQKIHPDSIPQVLITDPFYRTCKYCKQPFDKISDRIQHEISHKEEKKYACSYCSKRFSSKNTRENHENLHKGIEPLHCPHCPSTFATTTKRRTHIREVHLGITISCKHCDKNFDSEVHRDIHMRIHTKELPFQCEQCGRRFRFLFDFTSHRKIHENKREYKCEICGKTYNLRVQLAYHMINHSDKRPFSCDICGLTFRRAATLGAHKKLHSGIKAYECNLCGKRFAQSATLFCHKRTHVNLVIK